MVEIIVGEKGTGKTKHMLEQRQSGDQNSAGDTCLH